jgi:hypothetical protein
MRVEKVSSTVFTPLEDGTGVLLNLESLIYYKLNRTATVLWGEIDSNDAPTLEDLGRILHRRFEVDADTAAREVGGFIERLEHLGLARIAPCQP